MSGEEIEIIVTDDGMTVNAKNFKGTACTESLDKLLKGMKSDGVSSEITEQVKKPEYHVSRSNTTVHQRRS